MLILNERMKKENNNNNKKKVEQKRTLCFHLGREKESMRGYHLSVKRIISIKKGKILKHKNYVQLNQFKNT